MLRPVAAFLLFSKLIVAVCFNMALAEEPRSTAGLGVIIERATGSVLIIDRPNHAVLQRIEGFGDLSHASVVFSEDGRYAFVFGRDGGLTKLNLMNGAIVARIMQAGNSIGGAISDDGELVAVANYEPGGVRVFDTTTLEPVVSFDTGAKTIGLVDVPGRRFAFTTWETGETWIVDMTGPKPVRTVISGIGANPYDALLSSDGRTYIAGLFGEDGLTKLDLWQVTPEPRKILSGYGRGQEALPVYKMPHLEGWAQAGDKFVLPAIGRHEVLWVDAKTFEETGRTATYGQPVFAVARPDGRHVWVNFAHPLNDTVEVIDTLTGDIIKTLKPGPAVLHMEFSPRGDEVWVSVRDGGKVLIYDTESFKVIGEFAANNPSGIFFTARAHRIGL